MALAKYVIDARIKVSGARSILGLDNPLDLNQHIKDVVENENTDLTLAGTYDFSNDVDVTGTMEVTGTFKTDTVAESTAASGVTVDGALIKDGSFVGKQATATATAAGLTTGALTGTDQFVTVTSASANDVIALPLDANCPIGTVIRGWVGANGFELRSNATNTTLKVNDVTMGTTNEAAIPATTLFRVEKVASLTWLLTATDEVGAVITAIIPDAV
jgi:hypothetical protein